MIITAKKKNEVGGADRVGIRWIEAERVEIDGDRVEG